MSLPYLRQAEKCLSNVLAHCELNAFTATRNSADVLRDVAANAARAISKCCSSILPSKLTYLSAGSPLQGKLIAVKDNICTTNLPTTCASQILGNHASPFAATVITKLEAAGAVIHGKTNMDEFGMGWGYLVFLGFSGLQSLKGKIGHTLGSPNSVEL